MKLIKINGKGISILVLIMAAAFVCMGALNRSEDIASHTMSHNSVLYKLADYLSVEYFSLSKLAETAKLHTAAGNVSGTHSKRIFTFLGLYGPHSTAIQYCFLQILFLNISIVVIAMLVHWGQKQDGKKRSLSASYM